MLTGRLRQADGMRLAADDRHGPRNYRTFFRKLRGWLAPAGLTLLHCIGGLESSGWTDPWIAHYILPGSVLPSAAQITRACEALFVIEDWHNFGADCDRTLCAPGSRTSHAPGAPRSPTIRSRSGGCGATTC